METTRIGSNMMLDATASTLPTNDIALRNILALMGDNAALLEYLPLGEVDLTPLKSNAKLAVVVPYRMHFGLIDNGGGERLPVGILLALGIIPTILKVRWAYFSHSGELQTNTSISKVARDAEPAAAFRCLRQKGGMNVKLLRAVVRYYFIAKQVDMPVVWPVDDPLIKDLTAACRLAKANLDKEAGHIASQWASSQPSLETLFQERKDAAKGHDSSSRQQEHVQTRARSEDDIVPLINIKTSEMDSAEDGPEISGTAPYPPEYGSHHQTPGSLPDLSASGTTTFTTSNTSYPISAPLPDIARPHQDNTSKPTTPDADPTDFFKTYRQILQADNSHTDELRLNMAKQKEAYNKMLALKAHYRDLEEESKRIKLKQEQYQGQKKRLRESLSDKERVFLDFAMEIEGSSAKRTRRTEDPGDN